MKKLLLGAIAVSTILLTAACGPGLSVDSYPTQPDSQKACDALFADAPQKVAGEDAIKVRDDNAIAWGAPPIILRCGVERPAILVPDPTKEPPVCNFVSGVDWVSETITDGYLFTTIGRTFYVSLEVPDAYDPASDALADLASAVKRHDPSIEPCA